MTPETLAFWRDIAVVLLCVQAFILMLVPGALFYFGWYYLRKGRKALSMPLLMAQVYALRIQHITMRVTDKFAAIPINIGAGSAQVTTTLRTLFKGARSEGGIHGKRTALKIWFSTGR